MSVSGDTLISRRSFVNITAGGIAAATLLASSPLAFAAEETRFKAIAFDGFPIFDSRPVFALVSSLYPDKGVALSNSWRTAQFEYTWLRTIGGNYKNFWEVTENALIFAAKKNGVNLTDENKETLMQAYLNLNIWPDVLPALKLLKERGIRLCLLSNMTAEMLNSGIKNAGLEGYFEFVLSTDLVKEYKPSPKAYQMGIDSLKLKKEEIAFAAYAGWDAAGAKWFGYPTFWVNRQNVPMDELGVMPDEVGKDLNDLVSFIK